MGYKIYNAPIEKHLRVYVRTHSYVDPCRLNSDQSESLIGPPPTIYVRPELLNLWNRDIAKQNSLGSTTVSYRLGLSYSAVAISSLTANAKRLFSSQGKPSLFAYRCSRFLVEIR